MVKEIQYTSIKRVLDNLLDHPLLRDLTLEQAIRHTVRFIQINGMPKLYEDKIEEIDIKDFRGLLPCDLISIIQVKDCKTGICLRSMTDNFTPGLRKHPKHEFERHHDLLNNIREERKLRDMYIPPAIRYTEEFTFKTQGRVLYTSFPEGRVEVVYKSIPVDDDGFPLLVDNENFLAALEAYIKKQVFTVKFETGKLSSAILQNAQQEYAWAVGSLDAEFIIPSQSEMESLTRMWNTLIPQTRHFDDGFKHLGDREWIRKH